MKEKYANANGNGNGNVKADGRSDDCRVLCAMELIVFFGGDGRVRPDAFADFGILFRRSAKRMEKFRC